VPTLSADRRRERGYNQADPIAPPLAKKLNLSVDRSFSGAPIRGQLILSRTGH